MVNVYLTPFTLILLGLAGISFVTEFLLASLCEKSLVTVLSSGFADCCLVSGAKRPTSATINAIEGLASSE